jgi:2-methylcitrate dehydratase PrpD
MTGGMEHEVAEAIRRLAEFVAATDYQDLPAEVAGQAKLITADTIGVSLRGSQEPEIQKLHTLLPAGRGATILRAGFPEADPAIAAFANATATCFMELDEGSRPTGHPGLHVVPPTLALAQALGRSGPEYLAALVLGYDVQARISWSTRFRHSIHPHGNMGTVGATVALGKLSGWNAEQFLQGINIAAALTAGSSWMTCLVGATVRNAYPGLSAQTAFTARILVESGFTGYKSALGETFGEILGQAFTPATLVDSLGRRYYVLHNYFKFHACCGSNHPVLDALADAFGATPRKGVYPPMDAVARPAPELVRLVRVRIAERSMRLARQARDSQLSAKFSIPYSVAAYIVRGRSSPDSFADAARADGRIWDLASRVEVTGDSDISAGWPVMGAAEVEVELTDGCILHGSCLNPFGSTSNPCTTDDLLAKFRSLTNEVLSPPEQQSLWEAALGLENQGNMSGFPPGT